MILHLQIQSTTEEFKNHLEHITKEQESSIPPLWLDEKETKTYQFYGAIGDSAFRLMPFISGKTFFTPVFAGKYQGSNPVAVDVRVKSSPYLLLFYVFLMIAVVNMGVDLLRSVSSGNLDPQIAVVLLSALAALVIVSLMMSRQKKKLAHRFLQYLKLDADAETKTGS